MDRKICDGCGEEINGYFTKVTVEKMVYDGQREICGVALAGEHLVKEYDMCGKCAPRGYELVRTKSEKEAGL